LDALDQMLQDPEIEVIGLIGKPPAPKVWKSIQARIDEARMKENPKEVVLCLIGSKSSKDKASSYSCADFEETANVIAALLNQSQSIETVRKDLIQHREQIKIQAKLMGKRKGSLRGLFTGGTLCYEAQLMALPILGVVHSNAPVDPQMLLEDPLKPCGHAMVDYGDDAFTQGKLHPMMDPSFRSKMMIQQGLDPNTAVILFDLVLGYGCHPNPAESLSESIQKVKEARGESVHIIGSICGVEEDLQICSKQRQQLESAGAIISASNAEAALLAASLVEVDPL